MFKGNQPETMVKNFLSLRSNPGSDGNVESFTQRGKCKRQAVRNEIPIVIDYKQKFHLGSGVMLNIDYTEVIGFPVRELVFRLKTQELRLRSSDPCRLNATPNRFPVSDRPTCLSVMKR